jgi:hypothetical protein
VVYRRKYVPVSGQHALQIKFLAFWVSILGTSGQVFHYQGECPLCPLSKEPRTADIPHSGECNPDCRFPGRAVFVFSSVGLLTQDLTGQCVLTEIFLSPHLTCHLSA